MAGWSTLSDKVKLIVTVVSIAVTIIGAVSTATAWYVSTKEIIENYPKLQEEVHELRHELSLIKAGSQDTTNSPFVTKQAFAKVKAINDRDILNLFYYKFPYNRYGQAGIDF